MFRKKKKAATIDQVQLELIENAQKRVRQKKRWYIHLVIFVIVALVIYTFNLGLGFADELTVMTLPWSVVIIFSWLVILFWHFLNVFLFSTFMGKAWEKKQIEQLVYKQQQRINQLKKTVLTEEDRSMQSPNNTKNNTTKHKEKKNSTILTLIVAAGEDNAIGKDNDLIWHLSDDLKRFKSLTNGHHIIMGRKTFESFPKPLPNRTHIVITRQVNYEVPDGVVVVNNIEDALDAARKDKQAFIIGGGEIYKQAMRFVDQIEITRVHHSFPDADTFFPDIDTSVWKETNRTKHKADKKHGFAFSFITYLRN